MFLEVRQREKAGYQEVQEPQKLFCRSIAVEVSRQCRLRCRLLMQRSISATRYRQVCSRCTAVYTAWFKKPVHTARFKTRFEFAHLSQARSSSHVRLAYAEPSRG